MNQTIVFQELGDPDSLTKAEIIYKEITPIYRRTLGNQHPDTLNAEWGTARLLNTKGLREESHTLFLKVIDGFRGALGEDHPWTREAQDEFQKTFQ